MPQIILQTSTRIPQASCCDTGFLQMMVNRCIVGFHRYGPFYLIGRHNRSDRKPLDRLEQCLRKYKVTGNRELLVDMANYCMSEFTNPHHPKAHLKCEDQGVR